MEGLAIEDHDAEQTLDAVESLAAAVIENNCEVFLLGAHWADLNNADNLRGVTRLRDRESAVQLGGPGTPKIRSFAAALFAARIGLGTLSGRRLLADVLDTRHRLPATWERVQAREAKITYVRHLAQATRELTREQAATVDAAVWELVDARVPWSRFADIVEAHVVAADPEAAAARERAAAKERFAKKTRHAVNGTAGFYIRSGIGEVNQIDATVTYLAQALRALGDTSSQDERRVTASVLLTKPDQVIAVLTAYAALRRRGHSDSDTANDTDTAEAGDGTADSGVGDASSGGGDAATGEGSSAGGEGAVSSTETDEELCRQLDSATGEPTGQVVPADDGEPDPDVDRWGRPWDPQDPPGSPGMGGAIGDADNHADGCPEHACTLDLDHAGLLPTVVLYLHMAAESVQQTNGGVIRAEGIGPLTTEHLRQRLGLKHHVTIKPVIDLTDMAPVDAYEVPERIKEAVHLRSPADVFPYAANTSRRQDHDHTKAWTPDGGPGQTGTHNLGKLTRQHHLIKTHAGWQVQQPFPGIYIWRDPYGHFYLVDNTGTRKITRTTGKTPRRVNPDRDRGDHTPDPATRDSAYPRGPTRQEQA